MKPWPRMALGEVLRYRKDFIQIENTEKYKRCRVQLHAQGIVLRDNVSGADVKTKRQQVCRAGEFLVAEIDAKHGGFGLVPSELDGAIVSSHYFLFEINNSLLDRRFLDYFCRTPDFREQIEAQGSTNYAAIRPSDVLNYSMPFPALDEQRAIVTRLDAVAEKARRVEATLDGIEADAERLLAIRFRETIEGAEWRAMADVAPLIRREIQIDPEESYTELGIRSFYKGCFHRRTLSGSEFTWQSLFRVKTGDLIFSNIMAWEQAIAIAGNKDDNCVGNHRMLTCATTPGIAVPGFLWYYFTTADGFAKILAASPGTAARNKTLKADALMSTQVPIPKLAKQQAFDELQAKVAAIKAKHAETRRELKALLPSMLEKIFN
jgi:type I restriction enzyme S subunit